ncbi:MAG: serine hydrolase domain-containing protein [Pseudomonadota bacterium]
MQTVEHDLDFSPIHNAMRKYVDDNILSCLSTVVMRGTDILDYETFGYMDTESQRPLTKNAIYRMYSNTKIVTSVALMTLFEEGRFKLDDPLANYMPEFGDMQVLLPDAKTAGDTQAVKSPILIKHILSHSAGLSYGFIDPESVIDQAYIQGGLNVLGDASMDLEEFCSVAATLPLAYEPGTDWRYSVATDVCARLVEVLSGQKFDDFLQQRIFTPLNMPDTDFWVPEEKAERFITMYAPVDLLDPMKPGMVKADDSVNGQYNSRRAFLSGGGGLVSTISDYMTFIRMIVNGGEIDGARILQEETIKLMRTNQLAPGIEVKFPMWSMPGTVFGLGFALQETLVSARHPSAQDEYHWGGMAGTHTWMAPFAADGQSIMGMCSTQRMPGFWHPFSHEFKKLAYEIAG